MGWNGGIVGEWRETSGEKAKNQEAKTPRCQRNNKQNSKNPKSTNNQPVSLVGFGF
jgi:hypothetical protein